ncbi:MAG: RIP metalloprotease RseP [Candidatus Gygaella obscura]|nr:RIP metalloprotease RseP [Candidatus Gygaella obscura]
MSFLIFLVILSVMIFIHEAGHFIVARRLGMKVENFSLGFGKKIFSFKKHGTEYSLGLVPFGGYVKIAGFSDAEKTGTKGDFLAHSVGARAKVIFAGPLVNYIFAFFCFWLIFIIGFPRITSKVGSLVDGFPAQTAGVESGDRIVDIDGVEVGYWDELQEIIYNTNKDILPVELKRNDEIINLDIPVRSEEVKDIFGNSVKLNVIGIKASNDFIIAKYNVFQAFLNGFTHLIDLTRLTYSSLWWMITGKISFRESVTGPVGIYDMTRQVVQIGFTAVLNLVGVLSMSLAIFNLLPFPILDGGHIFFLLIEKIRKKRLSQKVEEFISNLGLSFIILMAVYVVYNDLVRFGYIDKIVQFFRGLFK